MASNSLSSDDTDDQFEDSLKDRTLGLKLPTSDYKDGDETIRFNSSDPNNPPIIINDVRINGYSDIFDPKKDYVGLIVYLCGKKSDFELGDIHCKTGDIFIKQSDWIVNKVRRRKKRGKYIHGRLFYSIFGRWNSKKLEFIGGGFSYYQGKWKFNSGTFNTMNSKNNDDTYHNSGRKLHKNEEKLIENVISPLYANHHWLTLSADERVSLKKLGEMKMLATNQVEHKLDLSKIHKDRKLHGEVTSFNSQRRYGYIKCCGIDKDIFVHVSEVQCCPSSHYYFTNDIDVEFNIVETNKGWQANNTTRFLYYS